MYQPLAKNSRIIESSLVRADISSALPNFIKFMLDTDSRIRVAFGRRKVGENYIAGGGFLGKKGDIIVDNITSPSRIFGYADGKGGLSDASVSPASTLEIIGRRIDD